MKIWLVLDLLGDLKEPSEFKCMENSLLQSYFFFFFFLREIVFIMLLFLSVD